MYIVNQVFIFSIGTKVTATVTVEIQITNRYYLTEYQDPSSTEYKKFEDEFKKEVIFHLCLIPH